MAKKPKKEEEAVEVSERWLVSYADMMTLLVALFIVLFAMSQVDSKKFRALAQSLNGNPTAARAVLQGSQQVADGGDIAKLQTNLSANNIEFDVPSAKAAQGVDTKSLKNIIAKTEKEAQAKKDERQTLEGVKEEIETSLAATGQQGSVKFSFTARGLVITVVTDQVLFESGSALLRPQADSIIHALGQPLSRVANDISVEGYTDNHPIATNQYPSNWELSTARATSVTRRLVEKEGVNPNKVGSTGYGEFRPAVPNDTPAHKAQNRRVEVVVLNSRTTTG